MKNSKTVVKMILLTASFLSVSSLHAGETTSKASFYQFQSGDFKDYHAFKQKYININLVLNKCSAVDEDLTSDKQYRCLQKVNSELTNANAMLYSKLDKYDKSDYTTGIDLGFQKAMKGCDNAYPTRMQLRFKNQILSCKLRLQVERINFIAFRSLPYSS
ncbi:hypothetical protein MUB04_16215 [Acinetobacter indicus]|uniref:hypothetical protein n=1 Tax=Acinetobacter TaxID=469 RepID=UPI0015D1BAD4|nr:MULTISPECIES: hypothetical protein [Acinetobacter]MCP0918085.1 hypothetical protein [Acinetobacter indicus]